MIGNAIANFFHEIMYNMLKGIAEICNTIISLMRMLLGMSPVQSGGRDNLMLSTVFSEAVLYAFLAVVGIAVITTFVFAIIRIIKYIHLFLKEKGDIVLPVTFFSHNSSHYILYGTENVIIYGIKIQYKISANF